MRIPGIDQIVQTSNVEVGLGLDEVITKSCDNTRVDNFGELSLKGRSSWGHVVIRVLVVLGAGVLHEARRQSTDLADARLPIVDLAARIGCSRTALEETIPTLRSIQLFLGDGVAHIRGSFLRKRAHKIV